MAIKEVKAGEKYTLELLGVGMTQDKFTDGEWGTLELPSGRLVTIRPCDFEALSPTRQDVRSEHSTVGTLNSVERWEKLWNGMHDVLFANGTKNAELAPKYDPFREFRKGDKVRLVQCNGRNPFDSFNGIEYLPDETIYTVEGDEYDNGKVELYAMDSCDTFEIHHSNIELVTPVEELEPYIVVDAHTHWDVADKNMKTVAMYSKGNHPHAKEAAEAECARMNAEHRKEKE